MFGESITFTKYPLLWDASYVGHADAEEDQLSH